MQSQNVANCYLQPRIPQPRNPHLPGILSKRTPDSAVNLIRDELDRLSISLESQQSDAGLYHSKEPKLNDSPTSKSESALNGSRFDVSNHHLTTAQIPDLALKWTQFRVLVGNQILTKLSPDTSNRSEFTPISRNRVSWLADFSKDDSSLSDGESDGESGTMLLPSESPSDASTRKGWDVEALWEILTNVEGDREEFCEAAGLGCGFETTWTGLRGWRRESPMGVSELKELLVDEMLGDVVGLDDVFGSDERQKEISDRASMEGERLLRDKDLVGMHKFLRTGCPAHLRREFWDHTLPRFNLKCSNSSREDVAASKPFKRKPRLVATIRTLLEMDSQLARRSAIFFPFEDVVRTSMGVWAEALGEEVFQGMALVLEDAKYKDDGDDVAMTVAALATMHGASVASMPFTFIVAAAGIGSNNKSESKIAAELFVRYERAFSLWRRPATLGCLVRIVEAVLSEQSPALMAHLVFGINAPKGRIGGGLHTLSHVLTRWIGFGFVGVLDVAETLLLMDRIVGSQRLECLAVVAAGLVLSRERWLLQCTTSDELAKILFSRPSTTPSNLGMHTVGDMRGANVGALIRLALLAPGV